MMLVAAGLASSDMASTFAIFTESHGEIHTGSHGSSAQSIEDLAIYRTLPNMTIIHPVDDISAEELTIQVVDLNDSSFMRTIRNKIPRSYTNEPKNNLKIGKGSLLKEGEDVFFLSQ